MAIRTARNVIEDAFHKMGLVSEDESISAEQASRGLSTLNDMMNGWEADGIQYQHTDLGYDDNVNVPDQLVWSTQWMLTNEIANEYGKTLAPTQLLNVARARNALQAYYYSVEPAELDEGIEQAVAWYRDHGVSQAFTHLADPASKVPT